MEKNRILLVDDDEELRTFYKLGLENHGFEVVPAATVIEALHLISTQTFDALLTDLHMPDPADGFTVVSAMRHTTESHNPGEQRLPCDSGGHVHHPAASGRSSCEAPQDR